MDVGLHVKAGELNASLDPCRVNSIVEKSFNPVKEGTMYKPKKTTYSLHFIT